MCSTRSLGQLPSSSAFLYLAILGLFVGVFTMSTRRKKAEADVETLESGRCGWAWWEPAYNSECDVWLS